MDKGLMLFSRVPTTAAVWQQVMGVGWRSLSSQVNQACISSSATASDYFLYREKTVNGMRMRMPTGFEPYPNQKRSISMQVQRAMDERKNVSSEPPMRNGGSP